MAIRENQDVSVKASPDYHINENGEPTECKIIQSLNDLKKFREKDNYTLIYDGNDLTQLFYERKMAGYEPQVRFTGCIISDLFFKFYMKGIRYRIKTQNLVTSSVDGTITVRTKQIYNKMSKAMYEFNNAFLIPYINPITTKPTYKFLRNAEQSRQWEN